MSIVANLRKVSFLVSIIAILLIGVALAGCSGGFAASSGSSAMGERIAVTGFGEASAEPDMATVQFGVTISADTVSEAVDESNRTMEAVIRSLTELGIPEADIQTTSFNLWPETQWDPVTGQPTEDRIFHVDNTVEAKIKPVEKAPEAIEAALNAGANNVYGLTFGIEDTSALETQARSNALVDAQVRAQQIASEIGVELGQEVIVSEVSGPSPYLAFGAEFGMGGGGGAPPVSPGELTVSVQLDVVYQFRR